MEAILSILLGCVLPPIVDFIEKKSPLNHSSALVLLAVLIGALYTGYSFLVPELAREQVAMFATSSIGTAVLVYEKLLKHG